MLTGYKIDRFSHFEQLHMTEMHLVVFALKKRCHSIQHILHVLGFVPNICQRVIVDCSILYIAGTDVAKHEL